MTVVLIVPWATSCVQPCSDEVWVQVQNYMPETMTVQVESLAPLCDDDGLTINPEAATIEAPQNLDGFDPPYVGSDPQAGHTYVFTVSGADGFADEITCNMAQEGIDLTYARMEVSFDGVLECACGFEESPTGACE
jgi:hypothetical protein